MPTELGQAKSTRLVPQLRHNGRVRDGVVAEIWGDYDEPSDRLRIGGSASLCDSQVEVSLTSMR